MKRSAQWLAPILWLTLTCGPGAARDQAPSGQDLVARLSCQGCHALSGQGGDQGPAWDGVGQRLSPADLQKHIVSPKKGMPNFAHLRPDELQAVVEYLSGMK